MKRFFSTVLFLSVVVTTATAQKLEVKGLSLEANDPAATQFAVKDYILTLIVIIPHRMPLMVYCPLVYQMRFSQNLVRLLAFYN